MLDSNLKQIIEELYSIPNAPFSIRHRSEFIKEKITNASLEYIETPYYIATKLNSNKNKKLIFVSHLDHPGFVFKNSKVAKAFGSLYLDRVKSLKPISVYNPNGKYIGDVDITKAYGRDESLIEVDSKFEIPKNSQGLWNVGETRFECDKVYGRSHDNDIATSILLNNLQKIENENFEIIFVFTKHEEVLQQSSYVLSSLNQLNISKNDIVINLESMKVYPTTEKPKYSTLDSESGIVLNISEATCIYGQNFSERNIAESLVNNIVGTKSIKVQRGMAGGTSDARLISAFGLTPNLVTLNIPNKYKHNFNGSEIVIEEVLNSDVQALNLIIKTILNEANISLESNLSDISNNLKSEFSEFGKVNSKSYLAINQRLNVANRNIIKRGYFFPQSILDSISDFSLKILSYIVYLSEKRKFVKISKD